MLKLLAILFGAAFTAAVSIGLGGLVLRRVPAKLFRQEERLLSFLVGSACLSLLMFVLATLHLVRPGILLAVGLGILVLAFRSGVHRPLGERLPPLPLFWRVLFLLVFGLFGYVYLFNAMAPEMSPDGSTYHLGFVALYLRAHGFERITTSMYGALSQGAELLYLFAFAFGRHSAAALVHFEFLIALPLLMLCYGRRFGFPAAGAAGAILTFVCPIVGLVGTTAYIDVAVAAVIFGLFYLLQVWDEQRHNALLIPIGLLAGFCYAMKYTAFMAVPYALAFVVWKSLRQREKVLGRALIVSGCALLLIIPWVAKNWIWLDNPFAPFLNRLFPNPYFHVGMIEGYVRQMRFYQGLNSYWDIPLELTVRGKVLQGLVGPAFLAAPIALLALRFAAGRQLLLAAVVFGAGYVNNVGTRFLIPALPFLSLAMGLVAVNWRASAPLLVIFHVLTSWPTTIPWYAERFASRLQRAPIAAAIRRQPEEAYFAANAFAYPLARLVESKVPKGERVLTYGGVPDAYTSREVVVAYQAAENNTLGDILWTPSIKDYQPTRLLTFRTLPQKLRRVRVLQTAADPVEYWSVSELRVFSGGRELPRSSGWRLRAHPNPFDVQLAFDNSPVTRWRSWEPIVPGMYLEVDFGSTVTVDRIELACTRDVGQYRLQLLGDSGSGVWQRLSEKPEDGSLPAPAMVGLMATQELKARGVRYIVLFDSDFPAKDYLMNSCAWGVSLLGEANGGRLYRID